MMLNKVPKGFLNLVISKNVLPIIIFIIAFSIRLVYLIELTNNSPFSSYLYLDALRYDSWAQSIAFGIEHVIEPAFRAPLYPLFIAAIYKIFGHNLLIVRLVQMFLGALICVLIYYVALKVFNKRAAAISAFIGAFYGPFLYWAGEMLIVTFIVFLDLVMLLTLLHAIEKSSALYWMLGGVVLGLSSIARPNVLIFIPWVIVLIFLVHKLRETSVTKKLKFVYVLCFLVGTFVVILPVTIRNYVDTKDFVLISSQGGINFYVGNNPDADGRTAQAPGIAEAHGEFLDNMWLVSVKHAEETTGKRLMPSQVSQFWYRQGLRFIFENPWKWFKLMSKKCTHFWTGVEITNNEDVYYFTRFSTVLKALMWHKGLAFPFGIICPLALVGIIVSRRYWRRLLLFYGFMFSYMLSVVLFFVCARYRMPVIPILLIFAGYTIHYWVKKLMSRDFKLFLSSLAGTILIGILVHINCDGVTNINRAQAHLFAGNAYEQHGNYKQAIDEYLKAIEFVPAHSMAYHGLGTAYAKMREYDAAEQMFRKVLEIEPFNTRAHFNLGTVYTAQSKFTEALHEYEVALEMDPHYELAAYWAAVLYERLGRWDEALAKLEKVLQINPYNERAQSKMNVIKQKLESSTNKTSPR